MRGMEACRLGIEAMLGVVERAPETWRPVRDNDKSKLLLYTRHADFTDSVVANYLGRLDAAAA